MTVYINLLKVKKKGMFIQSQSMSKFRAVIAVRIFKFLPFFFSVIIKLRLKIVIQNLRAKDTFAMGRKKIYVKFRVQIVCHESIRSLALNLGDTAMV